VHRAQVHVIQSGSLLSGLAVLDAYWHLYTACWAAAAVCCLLQGITLITAAADSSSRAAL
jgi:uncharacterized membrane protein YjjP (DUF1212 family)